MPRLPIAVIVSLVLCGRIISAEPPRPKIGDQIADLRFKDIRYLPRSLKDLGETRRPCWSSPTRPARSCRSTGRS